MKHFKHLFCVTEHISSEIQNKHKAQNILTRLNILCIIIMMSTMNTTLLPSVNTIALGMFCGTKYAHDTKHNMQIFRVIPFSKQHNKTAQPKAEKLSLIHI